MAKPAKVCATCGSEYEADALFCPKDGTPLGSSRTIPGEDPYVGTIVADQMEIRQLIGIGSMGRVYRAFQQGIERDVAVKMLHRELSANATLVGRFLREARIASKLTHPNVVQVLMSGQLASGVPDGLTGSELYIVMEYLDGISLMSALAASDGGMPLPRALHIVLQICDAVGEAHAQGIVHRDLKPENVMLVRRGDDTDFVKVLDFGIARLQWGEESVTQAGLIFGTARYISPEGSQGESVGPAGDVYAIATILYQCLAGRTPFDSDSPVTLLMQHAHEPPPPLGSVPRASYVPAPLAAAIMRNLSKQPSERSPDARTFGRELVEAAKASGMSPDELVMRSTLLGGQRGKGSAFTSLERTRQLELSAGTRDRIGTPAPEPAIASLAVAEAMLSAHSTIAAAPSESVTTTPAPRSSYTPSPGWDGARLSEPLVSARISAVPVSGRYSQAHPPSPSQVTVSPTGDVDATLDDDDVAPRMTARGQRLRLAVFVLGCFLAGAGAAAAGAWRMGYIGAERASVSPASYLERANDAIREHRWDSPPQANVKDITDEGLRRYPNDPGLLDARERAAAELTSAALGRKYAGDLEGALRLARIAAELHPQDSTAERLVSELEAMISKAAALPLPTATSSSDASRPSPKGPRPAVPTRTQPTGSATTQATSPPPPSTGPGRWL